jgi:flavodoxin
MSSSVQRRRTVVAALAALPVSGVLLNHDRSDNLGTGKSRILVAYFSRSGNTRVVAGLFKRASDADMFEIHPAKPYPEEYLATVEQARQERDSGFEPPLARRVANVGLYDTVYLGFPIWGATAPPVVRSFLATHELAGKTLIPFVTHGGYGLGNSLSVLARHAPHTKIRPPFVMQADQERKTMNLFNEWLAENVISDASRAS